MACLIVRAAMSGAIDYSKFDPDSVSSWLHHRWVTDEIERKQMLELQLLQHRHHAAFLSRPALTAASVEHVTASMRAAMNQAAKDMFPWLADQFGNAGLVTEREQAIEAYHELYGRPGEPGYEAMLKEMEEALQPATQAEKLRRRQQARLSEEQQQVAMFRTAQARG